MEENNNNEKSIIDEGIEKGKKAAKNGAKKLGKELTRKLVRWAWPVIATFLIILLAFGVINLVVYLVQSWFSSLMDVFKPDNEANSINQTQSIIYIDDDGAYAFNYDFSKKIAEELEKQKVNTEAFDFSVEELGDMIETYIKTEVQTMFPKIGSYAKDGLDGKIIIKRASANGEVKTLTYKPYKEFKSGASLDNFSINPENFKLCLYARKRYKYNNKGLFRKHNWNIR